MPSIIPDPGLPPAVEPITAPIETDEVSYTVDAGTVIYATDIIQVFNGWNDTITVNGTVWLDSNNVYGWFFGGNRPTILNNGLIYLHAKNIAELSPKADYLVNTGSIYSISDSGTARVINSDVLPVYVENSGLIAAQSLGIDETPGDPVYIDTWQAITIDANGWLQLINHEGGQILAEAPQLAIAVSGPGGDPTLGTNFVTNAGLIEANATGPDGLSIGIYVQQPGYVPVEIVNSGTIRADIAIYGTYQYGSYTWHGIPNPVEQVENQAGGLIEGLVFLDIGNDKFVNNGTVIGDVDMGAGKDVFSGSGSVSGVVDMGFDDDSYTGSGGSDRATGGRDNDTLRGSGGADLLLGGFGNDLLQGDAGNDALIGEWGNDTLKTLGGDYVEGGDEDDRVELGDYRFEKVDGGAGFDTLAFAAGARAFDLSAVLATGRVAGFEALELKGGQSLVVRQSDVGALTGEADQLRIVGTVSDTVNLVGAWVQGGNQTIDGALFETYTLDGRTVLVSDAATVTVGASAPAAGGLDAVGTGSAAPRPGAAAGLDYTDPAHFLSHFYLFSGDFTVDWREIFYSDGAPVFYSQQSEWTFTNNGEIYSLDDAFPSARGLELVGRTTLINNGLVHVEELAPVGSVVYYPSFGVIMGGAPDTTILENYGEISVYSVPNSAIGVTAVGVLRNEGLITAVSENSRAIGVNAVYASHLIDGHQTFFNSGTIYAEAGGVGGQSFIMGDSTVPAIYAATGVAAFGTLTNNGDIIAALGASADSGLDTVGIYLLKNYGVTAPNGVTNFGTIQGSIAIKFDNAPGDLSQIGHWVTNKGLIDGDIEFQDGADEYDGSGGLLQGTVFGFGGNDDFLGGKFSETFEGGDGNDRLDGNGGYDTLIGGNGDDYLFGRSGNDELTGGAGYDRMYGGTGDDVYLINDTDDYAYENVSEGQDVVISSVDHQLRANIEGLLLVGSAIIGKGNAGDQGITGNSNGNKLYGYGGNDVLHGEGGDDYLLGGEGNDILGGGAGYDRMYGGTGDDTYYVTDTADYAYENAGEGIDRVSAWINHQLRANIEELELVEDAGDGRGYGNGLDNLILGNSGNNLLYGRDGNDRLSGNGGNDILYGENGMDELTGGAGQDRFYGGAGADDFIFGAGDFAGMTSSTADRVHDFVSGLDHIDLGAVDANGGLVGDQAFAFIGSGAFTGVAGELRYQQISGNTYVQGDVDGDGVADFCIRLDGLHNLTGSDFII